MDAAWRSFRTPATVRSPPRIRWNGRETDELKRWARASRELEDMAERDPDVAAEGDEDASEGEDDDDRITWRDIAHDSVWILAVLAFASRWLLGKFGIDFRMPEWVYGVVLVIWFVERMTFESPERKARASAPVDIEEDEDDEDEDEDDEDDDESILGSLLALVLPFLGVFFLFIAPVVSAALGVVALKADDPTRPGVVAGLVALGSVATWLYILNSEDEDDEDEEGDEGKEGDA